MLRAERWVGETFGQLSCLAGVPLVFRSGQRVRSGGLSCLPSWRDRSRYASC
jgi:hypothetical protein